MQHLASLKITTCLIFVDLFEVESRVEEGESKVKDCVFLFRHPVHASTIYIDC